MTEFYTTADEAKAAIAAAIEAGGTDVARRDEFDIDAIFDATYAWDARRQVFRLAVDDETFWTVVERHAR